MNETSGFFYSVLVFEAFTAFAKKPSGITDQPTFHQDTKIKRPRAKKERLPLPACLLTDIFRALRRK